MTLDEVEALGQEAYVWGWPLVNAARRAEHARRMTNDGNDVVHVQGAPVGYGQIVMLTGQVGVNQRIICCPSRDVVYGSGVFHLTGAPQVIQIPDFGNRHWVFAFYDARTAEFSNIGRQYPTLRGFHLLVGPDWNQGTPAGIDRVWVSETDLAFVFPRVYTDGTDPDLAAIQPLLSQICSYPVERRLKFPSTDN